MMMKRGMMTLRHLCRRKCHGRKKPIFARDIEINQSLAEMPRRCIREISVVRFNPRRAAAPRGPATMPLVSRRALRIRSRSLSSPSCSCGTFSAGLDAFGIVHVDQEDGISLAGLFTNGGERNTVFFVNMDDAKGI